MNQIGYLISRSATYYKDKIAVIDKEKSYSFQEVHEHSNALARSLKSLGLKKGDRIAVMFNNCIYFVISDFALSKSGLVRTPINPRLTESEIEYVLKDSGARAILCDKDFCHSIVQLQKKLPDLDFVIANDSDSPDMLTIEKAIEKELKDDFLVETEDSDPYQILYTSGTTGKPKGAIISYRSRLMTINNVFADELTIKPDDRMLHFASLSHGSGSKVLPHFIKGAVNVVFNNFSPQLFFEVVEKHKITSTFMVPTMLGMLLEFEGKSKYDIHSLKNILFSGSPIPNEMLKRALKEFGPILVQVYALTEAPNPVLVLPKEEYLNHNYNEQLLESTGREVTNVQVRIVNDLDEPVGINQVGEIIIGGSNIMTGYWNNPDATKETIKDGWLFTGDLAYKDEQGYVYIVGRKKDMIITGGYNVYAREVEEVLYQIEGIKEAAVFGVPDVKWGETVVAYIVTENENMTEEDVLNYCKRFLAGYKKPKIVQFIDRLPKNANGKFDKNKLKESYVSSVSKAL